MYYAADNEYGTPFSLGFSNTWFVLAFECKADRDAYVTNADNLSARAILKREAVGYAQGWDNQRNDYRRPRPFSSEYWGVVDDGSEALPKGCLGSLQIVDQYTPALVTRFYK